MNAYANNSKSLAWLMALAITGVIAGCGGGGGGGPSAPGATPAVVTVLPGAGVNPTVGSATPGSGATNVPTSTNGTGNVVSGTVLTASFNQAMDPLTVIAVGTFTLKQTVAGTNEAGTVTMNTANTIATFTPTAAALLPNTQYTATVSTAAMTAAVPGPSVAMPTAVSWNFTTAGALTTGQGPINLGRAGTFAIFSNTAVTSVFQSDVRGNVGTAGGGAGTTIQCPEVTVGGVFDTDAGYANAACLTTDPVFVGLTAGDMANAYNDAAGRVVPDFVDLGAGNISGLVLAPGLYKWGTGVLVDNTGVTITGSANDVWIFQIAQDLVLQNGAIVTLGGAAQAKNIFWQVGGVTGATLGTTVDFKGIILADKAIAVDGGVGTGAVVTGRLLANTLVSLKMNTITPPAP